jgi:hypothetical protein
MELKISTLQIIDVNDWDDFIEKTYGKIYSFQQQGGCKDRGIYRFSVGNYEIDEDYGHDEIPEVINGDIRVVKFNKWLERDVKETIGGKSGVYIELFWHRSFYPDFDVLVDDLYKRGLINKGSYAIKVDW